MLDLLNEHNEVFAISTRAHITQWKNVFFKFEYIKFCNECSLTLKPYIYNSFL